MPQKISALPVKAKVRDAKTKYYGIPIGWEIGDKNHAGYPANSTTLVAESIIKICCFDAMESDGILDRERYGNNRYSLANIRQWLNKSGPAGIRPSTAMTGPRPIPTSGTATTRTTHNPAS